MELSQILDSLSSTSSNHNTGHQKTASHNGAPSRQSATQHNKLEQALEAALSTEKTASARQSTPGGDLVKIAQKLADAEQLALLKEAELYGAAVCDGFISRMNDHEMSGNVKTAAFGGGGVNVDEALVKQAMDLGYRETTAQLQKVAQAAFNEGYQNTVNVVKTAYAKGYHDTVKTAQAAYYTGYKQNVKTAQHRRSLIKTAASNAASKGYNHAIRILGNLR